MEHVKGKIQQGAGNAYFAGMQWRGKAQAPEARTWLLQNKAEFIALILGIEVVKVG